MEHRISEQIGRAKNADSSLALHSETSKALTQMCLSQVMKYPQLQHTYIIYT